jgi:polyhydroxyalkanoate synthesis regulator phasin
MEGTHILPYVTEIQELKKKITKLETRIEELEENQCGWDTNDCLHPED